MKKTILLPTTLLVCLLFQSCIWNSNVDDDIFIEPQSIYKPIIISRNTFEATTTFEAQKPITETGKIYIKDNYLFINEPNKGFHVFNNSNPENPQNIGYINALGASDLTIKDNVFYINNATDLIAVVPNLNNFTIEVTKRIKNTFPQMISPDGFSYNNLQENEIIINWTLIN